MTNKHWSKKEHEEFVEAWVKTPIRGRIKALAKQFGRTEHSIYSYANTYSLGYSEEMKDERRAVRTCITCETGFMSEWIGNRICPTCKSKNQDLA